MRDRFDIDQVIKITGLGIRAEQADGGADFDVACQIAVKKLWKIKEYESLEEQNRLLKLPCAVGDTVYEICEGFIEPCTVETIFLADYKDKAGNPSYMMEIYYDREDCPWVSTEIYFTDIGKTVFLTREEAALKELERGKG